MPRSHSLADSWIHVEDARVAVVMNGEVHGHVQNMVVNGSGTSGSAHQHGILGRL